MNNLDILVNTIADSFTSVLPFALVPVTLAIMFSAVVRFFDLCCRSRAREMHEIKKEIEKCTQVVDDINKKYPPISPCDFHKDCSECCLYNTGFCWKLIKERENK